MPLVVLTSGSATGSVGKEPDSSFASSDDTSQLITEPADSSSNFVVSIERGSVYTGQLRDTFDIILESGNNLLAGFDFRVAVESEFIEILKILPGEILDSCSWEFFSAKPVERTEPDRYPRSVWHVVALAELVPDETEPACFGFDRPASLVRMVLSSEHVGLVPDTTATVYFFWERCSDNSIAGVGGDTLSMSDQLYDYFPVRDYETDGIFPTRLGAPKQCIDPSSKNPPVRRIDFHNGGVEFELRLLPRAQPDSIGGEAPDTF